MPTPIQTVRGVTRLGFDFADGITSTVEDMHETIARRPLPWTVRPSEPSRAHGLIAHTVYTIIHGVNGLLREGIDQSLALLPQNRHIQPPSGQQVRLIATLNGVCGDHLEHSGNPLAISMGFSTPEQPIELTQPALTAAFPGASPHVVVLVHGLCLSDASWQRKGNTCVGTRLRNELDMTPVYLNYNSGRHISTNGRELAEKLQQLCDAWPVPVESLSLLGHSMGGLLIRSACWYADRDNRPWVKSVSRIACLGTPHHGAPMEKAGHLLDCAMQANQYVDPLLPGRHRSEGIKDLRHGNLLDEDWQNQDADHPRRDPRRVVPIQSGVEYYFIAATVGQHDSDPRGQVLGDLLVRLGSATGEHADDLRRINVRSENCRVFHDMNHFDLLDNAQVQQQIVAWFAP